jgi:hypothetical protein
MGGDREVVGNRGWEVTMVGWKQTWAVALLALTGLMPITAMAAPPKSNCRYTTGRPTNIAAPASQNAAGQGPSASGAASGSASDQATAATDAPEKSSHGRVVGGTKAPPYAALWQAEIFYTKCFDAKTLAQDRVDLAANLRGAGISQLQEFEVSHWCGGVLIDPEWVLTAAHCYEDAEIRETFEKEPPNQIASFKYWYRIRLGTHDIGPHGGGQTFRILQIVPHPSYSGITHANDIALMRIAPARLDATIRTIAMLEPGSPVEHADFFAYGWGKLGARRNGNPVLRDQHNQIEHNPAELQEVRLDWQPTKRCGDELKLVTVATIVCAGGNAGEDTCAGDSGGPLVMTQSDGTPAGTQTFLVGLVSNGKGCAQAHIPGAYTFVPLYRKWIDETIHRRR